MSAGALVGVGLGVEVGDHVLDGRIVVVGYHVMVGRMVIVGDHEIDGRSVTGVAVGTSSCMFLSTSALVTSQ